MTGSKSIGGRKNHSERDLVVVKYTAKGDRKWVSLAGAEKCEIGGNFAMLAGVSIVIVGLSNGPEIHSADNHGRVDALVFRLNGATGEVRGARLLGGRALDWGIAVTTTRDTTYVAGRADSRVIEGVKNRQGETVALLSILSDKGDIVRQVLVGGEKRACSRRGRRLAMTRPTRVGSLRVRRSARQKTPAGQGCSW